MKNLYDVIVIGGGPVGSYTARRLVQKGLDVCVIEQKLKIGENVVCAGVISRDSFCRFELPEDSILTYISSFLFKSPNGQELKYIHPQPFVSVVNRQLFDRTLSEMAKSLGARYNLGAKVENIEEYGRYYKVITNHNYFLARYIVIATGVNYQLQRRVGLGIPPRFLYGSQIELPVMVDDKKIEIYISQRYTPNSFAWVVPAGKKKTRIGMVLERNGNGYLKRFLKYKLRLEGYQEGLSQIRIKPIAYGPVKKSVSGRILAVGEAAGQVKTTTGGGIFMGLLCSDIAVEHITQALKRGKSLDGYDITWRSALSAELEIGKRVRQVASRLPDRAIERLFTFVKYNRFWVDLLIPRINFDFHSDLFYFCLKSFSHLLKIP